MRDGLCRVVLCCVVLDTHARLARPYAAVYWQLQKQID